MSAGGIWLPDPLDTSTLAQCLLAFAAAASGAPALGVSPNSGRGWVQWR